MSDFFSEYFHDEEKAENGIWIEGEGGARFRIRPSDTDDYRRELDNLISLERRKLRNRDDDLSVEAQIKVSCRLMANAVLVDWDIPGRNGEKVPFSKSKAFEFLMKSKKLRVFIQDAADSEANFRMEEQREIEKN